MVPCAASPAEARTRESEFPRENQNVIRENQNVGGGIVKQAAEQGGKAFHGITSFRQAASALTAGSFAAAVRMMSAACWRARAWTSCQVSQAFGALRP